MTGLAGYSLLISFIVCVILGPIIIPILYRLKAGQKIREIGPNWHKKKTGTPTMGGIIFIIAVLVPMLLFARDTKGISLFLAALGFGIIGFIDDFIKVVLKRNLGLTALQKLTLQLIVAVGFMLLIRQFGIVDNSIYIPFINNPVDLAYFYIPFSVLVFLATVNSVNLTDGLDGLAAMVTLTASTFFIVASIYFKDNSAAVISSAVAGGCVGFLVFNYHPAKVFMGDTGSLFLGGVIAAVAIILKIQLLLIIVGAVYLVESLSVIIQVIYFKLSGGKRFFKMSPIHHHFEMSGFSEVKIVWIFTIVTAILGIIAIFILQGMNI